MLLLRPICSILILQTVEAAINPDPPPVDNTNPAIADPQGNLTCLGDHYAIGLPVQEDFDPNQSTMQQLCAKTQYNGGPPGQHVGAWCSSVFSSYHRAYQRRVVFDSSPSAQINAELANPRILLGCLLRCYCTPGTTASSIQPVDTDRDLTRHYQLSSVTYEIKVDVVDDFDVPREQHMGTLGNAWVASLPVRTRSQQGNAPSLGQILTSMDPENSVYCRGALPTFPLYPPFQTSDFANLQELCTTMYDGGHLYVPLSSLSLTHPLKPTH